MKMLIILTLKISKSILKIDSHYISHMSYLNVVLLLCLMIINLYPYISGTLHCFSI